MTLPMKVGHKARRGRRRRPVPHKSHHKPTTYSRAGRRLKARMAELFAPRISDFEAELMASQNARPLSSAITSRASAGATASPVTRKERFLMDADPTDVRADRVRQGGRIPVKLRPGLSRPAFADERPGGVLQAADDLVAAAERFDAAEGEGRR